MPPTNIGLHDMQVGALSRATSKAVEEIGKDGDGWMSLRTLVSQTTHVLKPWTCKAHLLP